MKLRAWILGALCLVSSAPAAALDPVSLIVLRMLRDHLISEQLEARLRPQEEPAAPLPALPAPPRDLKALVDFGFPQLDTEQRRAIYARMKDMLADPEHAADREVMLQQFTQAALGSRQAHEALSRLTTAQKKAIAQEAAEAYRGRPSEEITQAMSLLRSGAAPIPADLRELMLAELVTTVQASTLSR